MCGCATLPGKQQIRVQHRKLLMIDRKRVTNQWELESLRRIVGVSTDADQFVASAGGEYQFSQVGSERRNSSVMRG
jgi:hypothetical protein